MPFDTAGRTNDVKASSSDVRIALARRACEESVSALNQILADTMTLRDLYKKHHWQTSGRTFYPLHLLFDKHHEEQEELVDTIAERIQTLGGTSIAMAADVAADLGDDGTNDLLVSDVVRTNEKQAWFVREHLRGDGK
jgi:starvation-inducible DNA-binding protein